jgi:hypothetical protein
MQSNAERCKESKNFLKIDAAFHNGDLAALRAAVDDPASVPNGPMPLTIGTDPNLAVDDGFPPLLAALLCSHSQPGSPGRSDTLDII